MLFHPDKFLIKKIHLILTVDCYRLFLLALSSCFLSIYEVVYI